MTSAQTRRTLGTSEDMVLCIMQQNSISPSSPSMISNFGQWSRKQRSRRRFDVDLTAPPDAQRRRLAAVEAPKDDDEEEKVVVVEANNNNNQDEDDEN